MDNNNMFNGQQTNQPYMQQQAYQPQMNGDVEEPVSVGEWIVSLLIMMIPCVNLVMMFVWAFGSGAKKSKSNYFKASLIFALAVIVIYIIIFVVFGASMMSAINNF